MSFYNDQLFYEFIIDHPSFFQNMYQSENSFIKQNIKEYLQNKFLELCSCFASIKNFNDFRNNNPNVFPHLYEIISSKSFNMWVPRLDLFYDAIRYQDEDLINLCINTIDPNDLYEADKTNHFLFIAAKTGNINIVKILMKSFVKDEKDNILHLFNPYQTLKGRSILNCALKSGNYDLFYQLKDLLNWNISEDQIISLIKSACKSGNKNTFLLLIDHLVQLKLKIQITQDQGLEIIFKACKDEYLLNFLLDLFGNNFPRETDENRQRELSCKFHQSDLKRVIHLAAKKGCKRFIDYLDSIKANLYCLNDEKDSILVIAIRNGDLNFVKYLVQEKNFNLDWRDNSDESLLCIAAFFGHLNIVQYLIDEKGMSIEQTTKECGTLLHAAVNLDKDELLKYLTMDKGLKNKSCSQDMNGSTPAHLAVLNKNIKQIKFMVEKLFIDFNSIKDINNKTPLQLAFDIRDPQILSYFILRNINSPFSIGES